MKTNVETASYATLKKKMAGVKAFGVTRLGTLELS